MKARLLAVIFAITACEATAPRRQPLSLAGHWKATGAATLDFTAADYVLGADAIADSARRGIRVDATAAGGQCQLMRYRFTPSGNPSDSLALRVTCPGVFAEDVFSVLPDTVKAFTVFGVGGAISFARQ